MAGVVTSAVDPETGLTVAQRDGRVWFKSGGSYFSANSVTEGLQSDPTAALATPDEVTHRLALREQDTATGQAKIATKELATHAIDVGTGLIRYPAMGMAALAGDQKGLDELQQLGGQKILENTYSIYKELTGQGNAEAAGRKYQEATALQTEANPNTATAAGIAGDVVPLLATGGLSAAGKVSGSLLSEGIAENTVGSLGSGLGANVGTRALAGAIQNAGYGMQAASEAAYLTDDPLTRQKIWAGGGMGALFGGVLSGGLALGGAGIGAITRPKLSSVIGKVDPEGSIGRAIGDSTVTKEGAQEVADRVMEAEGVPAAPGLGEKLHSLLTDIQAATTDADRAAIDKFGIGAILDPKTRVKALSGLQLFRDRPIIIEKASSEIADSMSELEKHAGGEVFESVRDLGMKRDAWEKLVDPAKRGEQVDAARSFVATTREKLESMLEPGASASVAEVNRMGVKNSNYLRNGMRDLADARSYYKGASAEEAEHIATNLSKPINMAIEPGENGESLVILQDGRHRMTAASEAGAEHILAKIRTYDGEGNIIAEEVKPVSIHGGEEPNAAFGDSARLKSALGHARKLEKALASDEIDGAGAAIELDAFKRNLGKLTKKAITRFKALSRNGDIEADAVESTARSFSDTYEHARQLLMNQDTWGKAGAAQQEINQGWVNWLDSRKMYSGSILRNTGEAETAGFSGWKTQPRMEVDPNKVGSWIDAFGTGRGKLNDQYIRAHIDATEQLTNTIGKYVDSGDLAKSVQAVKDAALKIKSNLKVASETVAVANQVQLAGTAHVTTAAKLGMAGAGAVLGGPVGAAAGAAMSFLTSPGKILQAAMAIQGLLSKVDKQKSGLIDGFFSKAGAAVKKGRPFAEDTVTTEALNSSGALDSGSGATTRRVANAVGSSAMRFLTHDGQPHAEAYQRRRDQLAALTSNPTLATHQIATSLGALPGIAPQLASSMAMDTMRNLSLLQQMAPPASPVGGLFHGKSARPTFTPQQDIAKFAQQWDGVMNPLSVLHDVNKGALSVDKVTAARAAHPELFAEIASDFLERMANNREPMSHQAALQADLLLGLNGAGEPSVEPGFLARIAALNQADQQDQRSPPSPRAPVNLAKGRATLSQSLEGA
jgi:hypothetical protein